MDAVGRVAQRTTRLQLAYMMQPVTEQSNELTKNIDIASPSGKRTRLSRRYLQGGPKKVSPHCLNDLLCAVFTRNLQHTNVRQ